MSDNNEERREDRNRKMSLEEDKLEERSPDRKNVSKVN